MSNVHEDKAEREGVYDVGGADKGWGRWISGEREDREDREIGKEKMSPERDITPLLGSKLPQLRLSRLPVNEVVNIGVRVVGHVYFLRGGAAMFAKKEEGALLSTGATIFIGGALKFFMAGVVPEAFATPLRRRSLSI